MEEKPKVRPLFPPPAGPTAPPDLTRKDLDDLARLGNRKMDPAQAGNIHAPECACLTCRARRFAADHAPTVKFEICGKCGGPLRSAGETCPRCAGSAERKCPKCGAQTTNGGYCAPCQPKKPSARPLFAPTETRPSEAAPVKATLMSMPGLLIRKRFDVSAEDLRAKNPDISHDVFSRARDSLLLVNLDVLQISDIARVGLTVQEKFATTSSKMLALTSNSELDGVNRGLTEMGAVLSAADLEKIFNPHQPAWKAWLDRPPSIEECKRQVKDKVEEVLDRAKSLRTSIPKIGILATEAEVLGQELDEVLPELETELVVSRYLIEHLKKSPEKEFYLEWADALQRRVDSLLVSRITVRQAVLQLNMIRQHLRHLVETVQTALVNMVPAWCGNCVSFLSSIRKDESHDSVRGRIGALMSGREALINLLKGES